MYSFIEMGKTFKVEEISSDKLMSIILFQEKNVSTTSHMDDAGNKLAPSIRRLPGDREPTAETPF
jgi:hypothetical protein